VLSTPIWFEGRQCASSAFSTRYPNLTSFATVRLAS
jgi:hypothetical protein